MVGMAHCFERLLDSGVGGDRRKVGGRLRGNLSEGESFGGGGDYGIEGSQVGWGVVTLFERAMGFARQLAYGRRGGFGLLCWLSLVVFWQEHHFVSESQY